MKVLRNAAVVGSALVQLALGKGIPDYAAASLVLGQEDFVSVANPNWVMQASVPPDAKSILIPSGIAVDPRTGKVFVSDMGNHRILRFTNSAWLENGQSAEAVFGQDDFNTRIRGSGIHRMTMPRGIFVDGRGRLWVADSGNSRVLCFDDASLVRNGAKPSLVLGQKNFNGSFPAVSASRMRYPASVAVDGKGRLWVADSGNSRVLRFDSIDSIKNGADADGVLGQAGFSDRIDYGALPYVNWICVSKGGTLFAASRSGISKFSDAARLANGSPATALLQDGSPGFSADATTVSIGPDDALWVGDSRGVRVLRYKNASGITEKSLPDGVIGQRNIRSKRLGVSARGLGSPFFQDQFFGTALLGNSINACFADVNGKLWVADTANSRVLCYTKDVTPPTVHVSSPIPFKTVPRSFTIKGTAGDANGIRKVFYSIDSGPRMTATGTTRWHADLMLEKGPRTIRVYSVDSVGNSSRIEKIKVVVSGRPEATRTES